MPGARPDQLPRVGYAKAALDVYRSGATRTYDRAHAVCTRIVPNNSRMASLQILQIAADYNNYGGCSCNTGFKRRTSGYAGVQGEFL